MGGRGNLAMLSLARATGRDAAGSDEFIERNGEVSPDGRWLSYESNESGQFRIYVRPFPAVDQGRWQVSTDGGRQPLWARNGRELIYMTPTGRSWACLWTSVRPVRASLQGTPATTRGRRWVLLRVE